MNVEKLTKTNGDDMIGRQFGNYLVTKLIGRGGMGAVYLAEHPEIGRKVAVKVLAPHLGSQPGLAQRFVAEAKAIARIDHPNIIDIYDFGRTDDGLLYYVMERLQGEELTETIRARKRMWPHEAVPYLQQICDGLQAAHDVDIVHRDLKPQNIFVVDRKNLNLRILDFGLAKLLELEKNDEGLTSTGMVMGSPLTIAPEQAAGELEKIGKHTDIYSLGIIAYWMLAGRPPFINSPTAVLMTLHIHVPPPPLEEVAPWVSPAVAKAVMQCLEKEPRQRPRSADAFLAEIVSAAKDSEGNYDPELFNEGTSRPDFPGSDADSVTASASTSFVSGQLQKLADSGEMGMAMPRTQAASPEGVSRVGTLPTLAGVPATLQNSPEAVDFEMGATTLSSAAGEVSLIKDPERPSRRPWALGATAVIFLAVLGGWAFLRGNASQDPQKTAAAKSGIAPIAEQALAAPAKPAPTYVIGVLTSGAQAKCEARIAGRKQERQVTPCQFYVQENQTLDLNVEQDGFRSFHRTWQVKGPQTLALRLLLATKSIVTEAEALKMAPAANTTTDTAAPTMAAASPAKVAVQPKPRRRRARRRASVDTPAPKPAPKPTAAKRLKLGEGVPLGTLNE